MSETVLPYNLEAEEHVVGACLLSAAARDTVSEHLAPGDLYNPTLATILDACLRTHDQGHDVDTVTLAEVLPAKAAVKMRELAASMYPASNVLRHTEIVAAHRTRRQLIQIGQNIARSGWEPPDNLADALTAAEEAVYALTTGTDARDLQHVSATLAQTFQTLATPGGVITGTATGLTDLDKITAGLQPGNLVVVAARPGMGKSALALQAALHTALHDQAAALFTLEMSAEEINQRALSILSHVPLMRIRTRNGLTTTDHQRLHEAGAQLERSRLYVDDSVAARVTDIRSRSRRWKQRHPGAGLIVVDYLHLMIHDGTGRENREQQVAAISRGLKLLAKELELPVMALAQLNRQPELRGGDKRPILADLRESGAIEQDADLVIFIHRDQEGNADLTVAKHRNGPTDRIPVAWLPDRATFTDLAEGH